MHQGYTICKSYNCEVLVSIFKRSQFQKLFKHKKKQHNNSNNNNPNQEACILRVNKQNFQLILI